MVTAELAAGLPVLVLLLAVAVSAVSVAGARVRVQDAAREAARAAARGDPGVAARLVQRAAPGATYSVDTSGADVVATVELTVHPLASWLPAITLHEQALAAVEPRAAPP